MSQGNSREEKAYNPRALTAIAALICGVGLPITGVANHLLQFERLTTARHAWMAAHNGLGITFLVFALWHVILNRRALIAHLKTTNQRLLRVRRELAIALVMITVMLLVSVGHALIASLHAGHGGMPR
jgi:hypothetical protein